MTTSERLRDWRKRQALSQQEAAGRAGVTQAVWSKLEAGKYARISAQTAERIERATGGEIRIADWLTAA